MQKKSILTVQQTQQLLNNIDQVYICKHIRALQGRARFTTCPDSTPNKFQTTYYYCMLVYKVYCSKPSSGKTTPIELQYLKDIFSTFLS